MLVTAYTIEPPHMLVNNMTVRQCCSQPDAIANKTAALQVSRLALLPLAGPVALTACCPERAVRTTKQKQLWRVGKM